MQIHPIHLVVSCLIVSVLAVPCYAADSVLVTATQVREESVAPEVAVAGTVFSRNEAQITAGLPGRLEWIGEPGDYVEFNSPVVRFDCSMVTLRREEQRALIDRARVERDAHTTELQRFDSLADSQAVSGSQADRVRADRDLADVDLRIARVRLRQIENELERCVVRAPFTGVITQRLQRAGTDVERSTLLATMTDPRHLEVRAAVPIRYLPRVIVGAAADVSLAQIKLTGQVRKVVPAADPLSQTFELRIDLPEQAPTLLAAGQLVSLRFALAGTAELTVPRDSIVLHEDGTFVMRITSDEVAERVAVEVADASGERVAIRGPLRSGDRVAVRGAEALDDGQSVSVQKTQT